MSTLKVGTIQDHANSNTAISIDSSGIVTQPVIPCFHLTAPSGTIATNNKPTWGTVTLNEQNLWSTSNQRLEAPVAGLYHLTCSLGIFAGANTTARDVQHAFYKNGSVYGSGISNQLANTVFGNDHTTATNVAIIRLAQNDYVEVKHNYVDGSVSYGGSNWVAYLIG